MPFKFNASSTKAKQNVLILVDIAYILPQNYKLEVGTLYRVEHLPVGPQFYKTYLAVIDNTISAI